MTEIKYDTLGDGEKCTKPCGLSSDTCKRCAKENKISRNFVSGIHPKNGEKIYGFAVKNKKTGYIEGILNAKVYFYQLAWIEDNSLLLVTKEELIKMEFPPEYVAYGV